MGDERARNRAKLIAPALAGLGALTTAALGLSINLATDIVPDTWEWSRSPLWVVSVTAVLVIATVALAVTVQHIAASHPRSRLPSISRRASLQVQTPESASSTQVRVGDIPGEPPGLIRRSALPTLEEVFTSGQRVAVVFGSRGVGKTQLAAAYARKLAHEGSPLVAWVSADTHDQLLAGLADVARAIGIADPEDDSAMSALRLRDHLAGRNEPGLLVVDNATDVERARSLLPTTGSLNVLITTTDQAFTGLGRPLTVKEFDIAEAVGYLEARTNLGDAQGAAQVAIELGSLPLALAQAASVIQLQRLNSYELYLNRLRTLPLSAMLPRDTRDRYPHEVADAILLSLRAAERADRSGLTTRLLSTMSVLAPEGVNRGLLYSVAGNTNTVDQARIDATLARLVGMSLLVWSETGESVLQHRLIARVQRDRSVPIKGLVSRFLNRLFARAWDRAKAGTRDALIQRWRMYRLLRYLASQPGDLASTILYAMAVLRSLRPAEEDAWTEREQAAHLIAHVQTVWGHTVRAFDAGVVTADHVAACAEVEAWVVEHLLRTADVTRAVDVGRHLVADCARVLGPDHPRTLLSQHNLAMAYSSAGRLDEAINLLERTVMDRERVLGPDHPHVLNTRNGLARIYVSAGRFDDAIRLDEEIMHDYERVMGRDHISTVLSRHNLATSYSNAGRLEDAIPLHERSLADYERALGPDHPDTLRSRHTLATAYGEAGRFDEAIALLEQTLADRERVLGSDHPDTMISRNNLATTFRKAGRLDDAIALLERTLADREQLLGPHHPDTLLSRYNLAGAYGFAGKLSNAISLLERTLADCELILSADHPTTGMVRASLREAYTQNNKPGSGRIPHRREGRSRKRK